MIRLILVLAFVVATPYVWAEETTTRAERLEKMKAYRAEQKAENQEFRKSLEGKSQEERKKAIKAHNDERHSENMDRLKGKLDSTKLTQVQKDEILKHRESQFAENKEFLDKVGRESTMTAEERTAAMKAHAKEQREENRAFRQKMRREIKSKAENIQK